MREETPQLKTAFNSTLLDASGQRNLIMGSSESNKLIWTLINNQNSALVVTPFGSGRVDQTQYHFVFNFAPGALTRAPTLEGWNVFTVQDDRGRITALYVALSGNTPLSIAPGGRHASTLTYTSAVQADSNSPRIDVTLTSGSGLKLGSNPLPVSSIAFNLTLVQANTPTLSVPPLAVDFVGRRTVLNDGHTSNSFTFAITNMTQADIPLTPNVVFTVWFDAAPNDATQGYAWALARVQDLASNVVQLTPPSAADWTVNPPVTKVEDVPVSPQWKFTVSQALPLKPQDPVCFTFSGIKTDLDPGVTRMYLLFESLPGFRPGILMGELEKTPLLYGSTRGQGLYLSAGKPTGNTPPAPNYGSGLYVRQFDDAPAAATFKGGRGLEVGDFDTQHDQYIALRVAGGLLYSAGIKLRAHQDNVGYTIQYNDKISMLQILRHWNGDPVPALEIKASTGKLTVYNDLEVKGDINGKTLTVGADALVVKDGNVTSKSLEVKGEIKGKQLTIDTDALVVKDGKVKSKSLEVTGEVKGKQLSIGTNALMVDGQGKVGIGGSADSNAPLVVHGDIKCNSLTIGTWRITSDDYNIVFSHGNSPPVAVFGKTGACWHAKFDCNGMAVFNGPIYAHPGLSGWCQLLPSPDPIAGSGSAVWKQTPHGKLPPWDQEDTNTPLLPTDVGDD